MFLEAGVPGLFAPGTGFVEDNVSMDQWWGGGWRGGGGEVSR